ncbi:hypothetical protein [Streptomyces sp. NPDC001404]|uniref:hypothetical protein n=1 Tax=Streptomyces sp. NPDC001404 TaxID=3364571 RepID=UPI0036BB66E2
MLVQTVHRWRPSKGAVLRAAYRDLIADQIYGLFWYRFLLGHAPSAPKRPTA